MNEGCPNQHVKFYKLLHVWSRGFIAPKWMHYKYIRRRNSAARTRRELELAREALARALRGNPTGRLELRGRIRRHDWGTTMLGYHVQTWKGRPIIRPSYRNYVAAESGFQSALRRDIQEGASEPRHSRDFLEGWAGTFRAWSMANMWKDGKLREAARELSAWSQSSGSRPLQ